MLKHLRNALFMICSLITATNAQVSAEEESVDSIRVYVGTYTRGDSKGIYTFELDPKTGKTTKPELAAELVSHTSDPAVLVVGLGEMGNDVARNLDPERFASFAKQRDEVAATQIQLEQTRSKREGTRVVRIRREKRRRC